MELRTVPSMGLRERNRRAAMRDTQREAMRLFQERGFATVGVEEIAANLGMAASTIFRHFGTKEALVLWDEHDAALDAALESKLSDIRHGLSPLHALRDAFIDTLASRYDDDFEFELERIRFLYRTEAVHAAAVEGQFKDREALTSALKHVLSKEHRDAAPILAGAAMLALDVAFDRWQESGGKKELADLIGEAFAALEQLSAVR